MDELTLDQEAFQILGIIDDPNVCREQKLLLIRTALLTKYLKGQADLSTKSVDNRGYYDNNSSCLKRN